MVACMKNEKGFGVVELLLIIIVIGLVVTVGWLIYDRQRSKTDNKTAIPQTRQQQDTSMQGETVVKAPEGWIKYQDASSGVSFYHPEDWEKTKFNVHKTPVSETVKGTNFGPYSAKYIFKKAENKWLQQDMEGNTVESSEYRTITTFPVSSYAAVYGYTGEGGGTSYYAVFTDGNNSYLIELPVIAEETDPNGFGEQKQAITEIVKTIKIN